MLHVFRSFFSNSFKFKKNNLKAISKRLELLGLEDRITPATITVTTLSDAAGHAGTSLRDAINTANGSVANDNIVFDSNLFSGGPGTITLAGSALPTIGNASSTGLLTISGPGASTLTISGDNGNASRNFNIFNIGSGADFTVSGVTVSGAKTTGNGGAFSSNSGILTVTDAVITNNTANSGAGIYGNSGTLTVSNTSITGNTSTGNGGGIFNFGRYGNSGPVKITNTTISGNNAVTGGGISNTAPSITITGSTITGNTASSNGGGINNDGRYGLAGPMTITNTTISGNNATGLGGGINTVGVVSITGSTIQNNVAGGSGGGIRNDSRYGVSSPAFSIDSTNLSNNTSKDSGGAISNAGPLTINNSNISGNTATNNGGGINNDSRYGNSGTFIVTNTTISGNAASNGGGVRNGGPIDFSNTTISGNSASSNGGGVFNDSRYGNGGIQTLTNVTIAGNSANSSGGAFYNVGGTVKIYNSILGNSTKGVDYAGAQPSNSSNNLITSGTMSGSTTVTTAQLNLGPLQNNGGTNFTMALGAGSSAIGAGNATISNAAPVNGLDQRGFNRTTSDIGAFSAGIAVTTTADTVDATDNLTSLREAIILANTTPGDDNISFLFSSGSSPYTITLNSSLPTIVDAGSSVSGGTAGKLNITGLGSTNLIISGDNGNSSRDFNLFNIATGGNLTAGGIAFSGAKVSGNGAVFSNQGTLSLSESVFSNNVSGNRGGAIHNSGTVSISSSRFENNSSANQGGAIYNDGTLTISLSNFSTNSTGNNGGAICQFSGSSVLTITNTTFSGNLSNDGGAIRSDGTLTLSNSTLTSNVASNNGGGLFNLGTVKITNSTFYGNTANSLGGGIRTGGIVEISSSTFSANSAGSGGAIENFDYSPNVSTSLKIANTILANSVNGGDYAGTGAVGLLGSATAANNLVSQGSFAWAITKTSQEINLGPLQNNGGPTFTMAVVDGSATVSAGNSSISNSTPVNGLDQRGIKRSSTIPTIGAYEFVPVYPSVTLNNRILAPNSNTISIKGTGFSTTANKNTVTFSNGAVGTITAATATELTVTLTTQPTSTGALTAIVYTSGISYTVNSGNPVQVATVPTVITVTTLTDTVNPSDNLISLREAITSANSSSGAEYVLFDSTLFTGGPGTITLAGSALPTIGNAASSGLLTIGGPGASTLTISGDNGNTSRNFNIFNIGSGADFTVSGVTVSGAKTTGNGGAFSSNSGILTVTDAVITNNTANSGAGIYGNSGTLTVSNTSITGNTSTGNGGGIFNFGRYGNSGPVKITNTTISGNNAVTGGGISNTAPSITITGSTITGNTASSNGGGINNDGRYGLAGPMTITNTTISGNNATGLGGGINTVGVVSITGSTIQNNVAGGSGGGIRNDSRYGVSSPAFSIDSTNLSNNTSKDSGGAISNAGPLTINNSNISGNTATNNGGGINNDSRYGNSGTFIVTNTTISGNAASNGGGVRNGGPIDFSNTTISGNSASSNGGGVFNDSRYGNGGIQTLTNVTIAGNSANSSGGAFYNVGGTVKIYNSILGNSTKGVDYAGAQPSNSSNNLITSGTMSGSTTVTTAQLNLGPLQNNGGTNFTMALGAGSSAIGAGNATISNAAPVNGLDQRGVSRSATIPSIGAFEYVPPVASKIGLTTNAAGIVNGLPFTTQPVITLQDSFGSTAANNNSSVTMTVSNGATTLGTTTINAINGVATFTDVGINGTVGTTYTLTFASNGLTSATQSVTVLLTANTPIFGSPTPTADGFTVQITNYDANFIYGGTATAGSVAISGSGLVTLTGVSANTSSTVSVTTTRSNYVSGSAQTTATSLNAANTPIFGSPTPTADGFTVQITNYNANFNYGGTASAGSVSVSGTGLVTVTGVSSGTSSTATITTTRNGYANGSSQVTSASLNAGLNSIFGTPTATVDGFTVQITNYDANFNYGGTASAGSVSVSGTGLVTVTGVSANTSSTATITTTRSNYTNGSSQVSATSLNAANTPSFGPPTATVDGFTVQITNYDANFNYGVTASLGSASISGTGLVTVSGLTPNTSSVATITTSRANYADGSAQISATGLSAANNPAFGSTAATVDGFTVQITNYDANFNYGVTASLGSASISGTGLVTVSGLTPNTSSVATITTSRTNYAGGSSQISASSLNAANTPSFGTPVATVDGYTVQITNYDANFNYGVNASLGSVSISGTGLVTVTGVSPGTSSTATITTTRNGYGNGSSQITSTSLNTGLTPSFGNPAATVDGFTVQITNYDANFNYGGTASAGSASINNSGLITVTGVSAGTSSTITITTSRSGYTNESAQISANSLNAANIPTFGTVNSTVDGYTVQITNYDPSFIYAGSASSGSISLSSSGLATLSSLSPNTFSTITFVTSRNGYAGGSAQLSGASLAPVNTVIISTPSSNGNSGINTGTAITLVDSQGQPTGSAVPFKGFKGEIHTTSADLDNDGQQEILAAAGSGGGPVISILDSKTGATRASFFAFSPAFTGGVFIAAKDINNDGIIDIIAGAGAGGGPHVKIFDGASLNPFVSFFAFSVAFTGGVSVASADINNDGIFDIVTGAGPGGGPHVKVFNGANGQVISQWFAYPINFTGGVFVSVGDLGNDGILEIVTGAGIGGAPVVAVWNPFNGVLLSQFLAYDKAFTGGVRVAVGDLSGDNIPDLVTGAGPGGGPLVKVFDYPQLDLLFQFFNGNPSDRSGVVLS